MDKKNSFFATKAGGLTIAFIVIMAAFVLVMAGLGCGSELLSGLGFVIIVAAMLYSPVRVFILRK